MEATQPDQLLIATLFDAQPESVVWFKPVWSTNEKGEKRLSDFQVSYCNNAACLFLNTTKDFIIGKRLFSNVVLDAGSAELIFEQCSEVYKSGAPIEYTYHNPYLNRYFNVIRTKVKDGVLSVTRDMTNQYLMQKEFEAQANKFKTLINTSGDGIIIFESIRDEQNDIVDFNISHTNKVGASLGKIPVDAKGKTLLQILPHLKNSEQFNLHKRVVETGEHVQFETTFRNEKGEEFGWFLVSLLKLDDGVLSRFSDLTEKKKNEENTLKQANFLNSILEASLNGVFACEAIRDSDRKIIDLRIIKINGGFTRLIGKTAQETEGWSYLSLFPTAKENGMFNKTCNVIEKGHPLHDEVYYYGEGLDAWYDISMVKLGEDGVVVTFTDITATKKAIIEIEQQKSLLDNILKHSPSGITVTEVIRNEKGDVTDGQTILANDASIRFTGIPESVYLTKRISEIDPTITNSVLFKMAVSALETGQSFVTQYLLQEYGKWLELGVSKMDDNHLVNVFTDVTKIKESQIQLERLVEELKRSNAQLEEFTFAASHDLKEPIRKISIFTKRLKSIYNSMPNPEAMHMWDRLELATERMQLLIDDLLEYSHVSMSPLEWEEIDLNQKLQKVLIDLELIIEEKKAKIDIGPLPTIKGYRRQIQQLFQNLLSNALKYNKPGVPPEIRISSRVVTGADIELDLTEQQRGMLFYLIEITDKGIGFDQKYSEKIFNMFQRLHLKNEYAGTGVGLSIARKVAENHNGHITAKGEKGKGAQFKVYLPK